MSTDPHAAPTRRVLADRFELRRELGRGGMATVWSAHDRTLDRMVAVKVLRGDLSDEHADRIQREARAAARIDDPRVVKVLDLEHDADGTPFLVLEELEGRTLADELRDGPLAAARAGRLAEDLLGGLAAAHERGVLHRDVKPTNVLAAGEGFRITDFGIASLDDEATTGDLMGTLVYVAPERFDGAPATPRSDVFSAAAVLYEALSGHQPFRGSNPADSLERLRSGRFDPLPDRVPAALERAITMALDPDPAQRPADAGAFARLAGGGADPVTDTLVGAPDQGDVTERLDHVLRVPAPTGGPPSSFDERTTVIERPEPVAPVAPPPPEPRTPWREDPRVERLAEVSRRPQTIFVAVGVVLLIAVLIAAASAGGDDGQSPVTEGGGEPAEQLEQQLDRIEELGR